MKVVKVDAGIGQMLGMDAAHMQRQLLSRSELRPHSLTARFHTLSARYHTPLDGLIVYDLCYQASALSNIVILHTLFEH